MNTINQSYVINAPIDKVWWALTTAEGGEQWGAGPAKFNVSEGGEFSYWNGDIHGTNTKVVFNELLEQDWYGHDAPNEKYRVVFRLEGKGKSTIVTLSYSGNIKDEQKDIKDWQDYYFEPIKKLIEKQ